MKRVILVVKSPDAESTQKRTHSRFWHLFGKQYKAVKDNTLSNMVTFALTLICAPLKSRFDHSNQIELLPKPRS